MTMNSREQFCLRITPEAYKCLTALSTRLKNISTKEWTASAIVNLLISRCFRRWSEVGTTEANQWFEEYRTMRETKKEDGHEQATTEHA